MTTSSESTAIGLLDIARGCASLGNLYDAVPGAPSHAVVTRRWKAGLRLLDMAPRCRPGLLSRTQGNACRAHPRPEYNFPTKVERHLELDGRDDRMDAFHTFGSTMSYRIGHDDRDDGMSEYPEVNEQCSRLTKIATLPGDKIGRLTHCEARHGHLETQADYVYPLLDEWRSRGAVSRIEVGVIKWRARDVSSDNQRQADAEAA